MVKNKLECFSLQVLFRLAKYLSLARKKVVLAKHSSLFVCVWVMKEKKFDNIDTCGSIHKHFAHVTYGLHGALHNDTQHNDIQHIDTQHIGIQHNNK